jgi:hypothetical protein
MAWMYPGARSRARGCRWLVCVAAASLMAAGAVARGADRETREFAVLVDGKPAGGASMTIERQDDGSTTVSCDTTVTVRVLIKKYVYTCQTREVWKEGRLQQLTGRCNDDGKQFQVTANAQDDGIHVRVNGREHTTRLDAWLSSYWTLPDRKIRDQVVAVIDADNGRDMQVRIQNVGDAQIPVAGQLQNVQHYRLTGTVQVDLWYDASERLVRESFVEDGHPTVLELARVRR